MFGGGLMMGRYKLHGGVIRWAAGAPNAGQIVKHLLPACPFRNRSQKILSYTAILIVTDYDKD